MTVSAPDGQHAKGADQGCVVLAATPIGNVEDASPRLRRLIATADVVAAEDTRRLLNLARELGVEPAGRVLSYHEHNERAKTPELLDAVAAGATVLVVTDAGMPAVSDPGFRIAEAATAAGLRVTAAPGPSAVLTALALSGLPTDRFCFEGFPARKPGERARQLAALADEPRTIVLFEAPHRIETTVADLAAAFGADRPAALCRELTKTFEQIRRGTLGELLDGVRADPPRGEIVLVVAGAPGAGAPAPGDLVPEVLDLAASGLRLKDAAARVAERTGAGKRDLYEAALRARDPHPDPHEGAAL